MTAPGRVDRCPCGRARPAGECCARFIRGEALPATAEELMRSRYTAYATGAVGYLLATQDPATLAGADPAEIAQTAATTRWQGLRILATEAGGADDAEGFVLFEARYGAGGRAGVLRERSRFRRLDGRWLYVEPTAEPARPAPVGRNERCPCGSGRKSKHCCGR